MIITMYLFEDCELIDIQHFASFTDMVVYLIHVVGRDTYKQMEKFYNKHGVLKADGYIAVSTNYIKDEAHA